MSQYEKYIFWLKSDGFEILKNKIESNGKELYEAKKAVCVPLSKRVDLGYIAPDVWDKFDICRRQMSWYRQSPRAGQYLVISSSDLAEYGLVPETIIKDSRFRPLKLPDDSELKALIDRESYKKTRPDEWEDIANEDPAVIDKWMRVMGIRRIKYEDLFVYHCANHANFIEPKYYVEDDGYGKVPYSINNKTNFICSACMEFYNVVGSEYKKKFVVPCPGCAIFAGLPVNRYFEVVSGVA